METNEQCSRCMVLFVRYARAVACPNCGLVSDMRSVEGNQSEQTFLSDTLALMRVHKRRWGRYAPPAWDISSLAHEIQLFCFRVFDAYEAEWPSDHRRFIERALDQCVFRHGRFFMKPHARAILTDLFALYNRRMPRHTPLSLVRKFFFLP